jgi:hypothetical protein
VQAKFLDGNGGDPGFCQRAGYEVQSFSGAAADDDVARSGPNSPGTSKILGEGGAKLRPPMWVGVAERLERCSVQRALDRTTPLRPWKRRQVRMSRSEVVVQPPLGPPLKG